MELVCSLALIHTASAGSFVVVAFIGFVVPPVLTDLQIEYHKPVILSIEIFTFIRIRRPGTGGLGVESEYVRGDISAR